MNKPSTVSSTCIFDGHACAQKHLWYLNYVLWSSSNIFTQFGTWMSSDDSPMPWRFEIMWTGTRSMWIWNFTDVSACGVLPPGICDCCSWEKHAESEWKDSCTRFSTCLLSGVSNFNRGFTQKRTRFVKHFALKGRWPPGGAVFGSLLGGALIVSRGRRTSDLSLRLGGAKVEGLKLRWFVMCFNKFVS